MPTMQLTVLQKDLTKALAFASHFVSSRAQLPILSNIALKARGTKLTLEATNLEMSCSTAIGAQIEEEGSIAVSSRTFSDLIANLKSEKVVFTGEGESLKVTAENFTSTLAGLNISDFPAIPNSIKNIITLPKEEFCQALESTIFSCATDLSRPALAGVLLIFKGKQLALVASDGFRLSRKILSIENTKDQRVILPKNFLVETGKIASSAKAISIDLEEANKQAIFALDDTILSSRFIEGDYPPFEKIIPASSSITVSVDKADLLGIIKTVSVLAREAANVLTLHIGENSLKVSAQSPASGTAEASIEARVEGPELDIPYNYRFIEEFLNVVKGKNIVMKFNAVTSVGAFLDADDQNYLHLIMPVKS